MDPLSVTAGVVGIASFAAKVSRSILESVTFEEKGYATTIKLELEIYTKILEEVGQIALSGLSELPMSAQLSLQLCHLHLSSLENVATKPDSPARKKIYDFQKSRQMQMLQAGLKDYRRSVKILREIVTDAMTQQALSNRLEPQSKRSTGSIEVQNIIDTTQGVEMVEKQIEALLRQLRELFNSESVSTGQLQIQNIFTDRATQQDGLSEDVLARLRKAAEGVDAASRQTQNTSNPFEFFAKIMGTEQLTSVCAKLDTGSEDNWISATIVNHVGLEDSIVPTETEKLYSGADGSLFLPMGMLNVSWTRNSSKSWQTDFLVVENAPFDMLLGRKFIIKEGLFVFADPVLVTDLTRLVPLSKEDYHQMEQNMRERGIENEELSKTRDAKDAAARARRRAEKAASRMSLATSSISLAMTPGTSTPSLFQPTPSLQSQSNSMTTATTRGDEDLAHAPAQDDAT